MRIRKIGAELVVLMGVVGCCLLDAGDARGQEAGEPEGAGKAIPSEEETREVAMRLERAINKRDLGQATALMDWDRVTDRALEGLELPPDMMTGVRRGLEDSVSKGDVFKRLLGGKTPKVKSYTFMRIRNLGEHPHILYRMIRVNGGLDYHDYELEKQPDGAVRAIEMSPYMMGEPISKTIRNSLANRLAPLAKDGGVRLNANLWTLIRGVTGSKRMTAAVKAGRFQEALEIYDRLPKEIQADKAVKMNRLLAAQAVDLDESVKVIEDIRNCFPEDRGIDLLSFDLLMKQKRFDDLQKAIDRVRDDVGGDAYLEVMRSHVFTVQGKMEEARKAAEKAIEEEPSLVEGYTTLLDLVVALKDHKATLRCLRALRDVFGLQIRDLTTVPAFAEFVKSDEYQEWKKDEAGVDGYSRDVRIGRGDSGSRNEEDAVGSRSDG